MFGSTDLAAGEWLKIVAAGLMVFCVAELEKWIIRRSGLDRRLGLS